MAEVSGFSSLISFLTGADAFSLMFPFLLAWMLFYAAIEKSEIFDDTSLDNAPPLMAMILAFFTARFLVAQPFYQTFFSDFFGKIVIGLASILGLFTLLAFSGVDVNGDDRVNKWIKIIGVLMAGSAFVWAGGFGPGMITGGEIGGTLGGLISSIFETGFIWLLVVGAAMGAVMYTGNSGGGNPGEGGE